MNEIVDGISETKQNKQNMRIQGVKRFEFLIKLCTAITIEIFSTHKQIINRIESETT